MCGRGSGNLCRGAIAIVIIIKKNKYIDINSFFDLWSLLLIYRRKAGHASNRFPIFVGTNKETRDESGTGAGERSCSGNGRAPVVRSSGNESRTGCGAAEQQVAWVLEHFPGRVVLTSSFGAQSAVCLHMVTRQQPDIPVVLVDTGYLFPETYQFIDELSERLSLNLQIYRAELSAAWQEARLWQAVGAGFGGSSAITGSTKVEPMQRALRTGGGGLDFRPAPAAGQEPPASRRAVMAQRPLQGPSLDRLDRPRCLPLPEPAQFAVSPVVASGLCLHRRHPYHPTLAGRHERGRNSLLRPQARMRSARACLTDHASRMYLGEESSDLDHRTRSAEKLRCSTTGAEILAWLSRWHFHPCIGEHKVRGPDRHR